MNKIDQLFIRACKSRNPKKRVLSVYRRFYCSRDNVEFYVAGTLTDIVDKNLDYSASDMLSDMNPDNAWRWVEGDASYWERVNAVLISKIRLSKIDKFEGLTAPLMFKKVA
tara:strand:+ start:1313 stop:1645 length:333 start_codon:yes stop_codon:yes gene_type:complete